MRKARKIASMANDQCKEQESGTSKRHKKSNDQFILLRRWTSVISKMRSWNPNFRNTISEEMTTDLTCCRFYFSNY